MNNIYAAILDRKKTYFLDWLHSSLSKVKKNTFQKEWQTCQKYNIQLTLRNNQRRKKKSLAS